MNESKDPHHRGQTSLNVAFLALGSIGDVLPLVTLAAGSPGAAALITHECHRDLLHGETSQKQSARCCGTVHT